MKKLTGIISATVAVILYAIVAHAGTSSATLTSFIQSGTITNTSGAGVNIVEVFYTLGTPEDNLATWEGSTGGGAKEDPLSNPNFFQSIRWTGLNVAPGAEFNFSGLDIDLIVTLNPLNAVGSPLGDPVTLRNAYIETTFSDGSVACAPLVEQAWNSQQNLTLTEENVRNNCSNNVTPNVFIPSVPVPTLSILGLGILAGLFALIGLARRRTA